MTAPRYLLCPGLVTSRTDGQRHHIDARRLAFLYGVPMPECIVLPPPRPENLSRRISLVESARQGELVALVPRYDGNYSLPPK